MLNKYGDMMQPCRTSRHMLNQPVSYLANLLIQLPAAKPNKPILTNTIRACKYDYLEVGWSEQESLFPA